MVVLRMLGYTVHPSLSLDIMDIIDDIYIYMDTNHNLDKLIIPTPPGQHQQNTCLT